MLYEPIYDHPEYYEPLFPLIDDEFEEFESLPEKEEHCNPIYDDFGFVEEGYIKELILKHEGDSL